MSDYTMEEQIVSQIARSFGPDDDMVTTAVTMCGFVGLCLAQELYAPNISYWMEAKGRGALLSKVVYPFMMGSPPQGFVETLCTTEDIFEWLAAGKWCILMQAVQIDKFGYTNLSLVGDKKNPSSVFVGSRGVPDNTVNGARTYFMIPGHSTRTFVEKVDFISGVGNGPERKEGIIKYGATHLVFSNLGIFDFEEETGRMRLKSVHVGVTVDQVKKNTGFELAIPDSVPETDPPTAEELHYMREVIDPLGIRRLDFAKGEANKQVMAEVMSGTTYQMLYGKRKEI